MWLVVSLNIFSDLIFAVTFVFQVLLIHYHAQTEILQHTTFFWKDTSWFFGNKFNFLVDSITIYFTKIHGRCVMGICGVLIECVLESCDYFVQLAEHVLLCSIIHFDLRIFFCQKWVYQFSNFIIAVNFGDIKTPSFIYCQKFVHTTFVDRCNKFFDILRGPVI